MTDENIDRKLHELMGHHWHEYERYIKSGLPNGKCTGCPADLVAVDDENHLINANPIYSTSISDAVAAVERVAKEKQLTVRISNTLSPSMWAVSVDDECGNEVAHAESERPETAITLALIEALEAK